MQRSVSIVTVCMNRVDHLLRSSAFVSRWPHHAEHLIVDWSSRDPIERCKLPGDERVRLLRVDGEKRWNLSRAYNFAVAQSTGDCVFKLDADCWPEKLAAPDQLAIQGIVCHFGTGPDGRLGQWLLDRSLWDRLGGFNEFLEGYGFDDKDFKARVLSQLAISPIPLEIDAIGVISHSVSLRAGVAGTSGPLWLSAAQAHKKTTALSNRVMAASCPWSLLRSGSVYVNDPSNGRWQLVEGTLPQAPAEVQRSLQRLRRETFWSEFLWIPAPVVRNLPHRLLPPDTSGDFSIAIAHQILWWFVRLCSFLPLFLLHSLCGRRAQLSAGLRTVKCRVRTLAARSARLCLETSLAPLLPQTLHRLGLMARVEHSISRGSPISTIWTDLELLWLQHGSSELIHRLLFRRGFRPSIPAHQVALFDAIASSEIGLPAYLKAYALVSTGYRSLKDSDAVLVRQVDSRIDALIVLLINDADTFSCELGNRRNRLKLLVSCLALQCHLRLLLGTCDAFSATVDQALLVVEQISWLTIPADVAYRLLTNAARVLGFAALVAWRDQSVARLDRVSSALQNLLRESQHQRHSRNDAQEDHRRFVLTVLQNVSALVFSDLSTARPLADCLLNVQTPALQRKLDSLLLP
jgi:hypothetical protein